MLKLTLKPGEYIDIGENVRVIFSGGSANNIHLLIDAPKELAIARSNAGESGKKRTRYHSENKISPEAQREIVGIIMKEKKKQQNEADKEEQNLNEASQGQPHKAPRRYYTAGAASKAVEK